MASPTVDLNVLNTLLAQLDVDNVFSEPSQQPSSSSVLPSCRQTSGTRAPLGPSLSVPLPEPFYPDLTSPGAADVFPLSTERRAPRAQSITDSTWPPGPEVQKQPSGPARYKTELCRPFEENGTCRYGSKCQFAHGRAELRSLVRHPKYKTDLCRTFHTTGLCPYGPRCHFIHNDDERRLADADQSGAVIVSAGRQMQAVAERDEVGRRLSSVQETRGSTRLHRQYSEYQPTRHRPFAAVSGTTSGGGSVELHRRASSVAESVIRHSIASKYQHHHQRQLLTLLDPEHSALASTPSVGSVADSFSSASSVTDSPSPSPTHLPPGPPGDDCSTPTGDRGLALPLMAAGWPGSDDHERARLAELVSRLEPHDVATLIRALQNQQQVSTHSGTSLGQLDSALHGLGSLDSADLDAACIWTQLHPQPHLLHYQQQQQQQRSTLPSNACW